MQFHSENAKLTGNFAQFLMRLGSWIIMFCNFIPISLLITLDFIRVFQALLLISNKSLISIKNSLKIKPKVHSSNLNEDLGQI
jgi:phospholipid-transporting ATPase